MHSGESDICAVYLKKQTNQTSVGSNQQDASCLPCTKVAALHQHFVVLSSPLRQVVAVAARSLSDAQAFGKKHSIPQAYGSYEELANDPNIGASE